jgi:hypothetical protein
VLLLDEPLGALDLKLRKQMQVELSRIHRQVGTTFVFVTHDQEEALSMADTRSPVMSGGHVRQIGPPREIYMRPVDRFVGRLHRRIQLPRRHGHQRRRCAGLPAVERHDPARPRAVRGAGWAGASSWSAPNRSRSGLRRLRRTVTGRRQGPDEPRRIHGNHTRITVQTDAGTLVAIHFASRTKGQSRRRWSIRKCTSGGIHANRRSSPPGRPQTKRGQMVEEQKPYDRADQTHSRRRFLQLTGAVGATAALGGVLQACNVIGGGGAATTGTFNWMTWSDHWIQSQLDKIATDTKISTAIQELAGNAEGYAKLKEVKGQLDKMSGDAMWVPNAYNKDGLIEPFDINELKVSTQLYSFAREFPYWQSSEGYIAYPFGWSPIMIYYDRPRSAAARRLAGPARSRSTRAGSSSRTSRRRSSRTWRVRPASTSRTT